MRSVVFLPTIIASFAIQANAAPAPTEGIHYFEKNIRPLLITHCYECHSAVAKSLKGNLQLDSRAGWQTGGDSGPALIPGKADESLLIKAVTHLNGDLEMPPKTRLSEKEITHLKHWINLGAPDPRNGTVKRTKKKLDLESGRQHWSFRPTIDHATPGVRDTTWPANSIDHFILARLESQDLTPAPPASKATLLRRLFFDLTGLPPTRQEMADFLADSSPRAFEKIVDDLLARPEFGERWGRHWLDVTRFAESSGGGRSLVFPAAWRFRDYVIRSFNEDKPFSRLIREHLAGDLLPAPSPEEKNDALIASGYLVLGPNNYELQDHELLKMEFVDEQIDTVGRTFLGMTLGCARCHDHKFDPIPTRDYYALAGIFQSTRSMGKGSAATGVTSFATTKLTGVAPPEMEALRQQIKTLQQKIKAQPDPPDPKLKTLKKEHSALTARLKKMERVAMAPAEAEVVDDAHIRIRGQVRNKGPKVPRGFLTVAMKPGQSPEIPANQSGRLQLADWVASPDNPLTARVIANRVWKHLLGEGIVRTPDNFGRTGQAPGHPKLLDHLAHRLINKNWSLKSLIRDITLSQTYRQSSRARHDRDPENRLFGRANRKRLEAEAIRDAMLKISGQLDPTRGGFTIRNAGKYDLNYTFKTNRRSVYVPWFRNSTLDLFEVFDVANPNLVVGRRPVTNLPTQSLFLMNSPFVRGQARHTAKILIAKSASITETYQLILSRPPSESELLTTTTFLKQFTPDQSEEAWIQLCQTLFACLDFRFLD